MQNLETMEFLINPSFEYDLRGIWSTFIGVYFFKIFCDQKKDILRLEESILKKFITILILTLAKMIECMKTIISSKV